MSFVSTTILPSGVTYETYVPAATPEHTTHESVNVDNGQVVVDGHANEVITIAKTLQAGERYIDCKDENGSRKFSVLGDGTVTAESAYIANLVDANEMYADKFVSSADHTFRTNT